MKEIQDWVTRNRCPLRIDVKPGGRVEVSNDTADDAEGFLSSPCFDSLISGGGDSIEDAWSNFISAWTQEETEDAAFEAWLELNDTDFDFTRRP